MTRRAQGADGVLLAMAFDRKTFKNKLQDILGGAITHFYMVKLAELMRARHDLHAPGFDRRV